MPDLNRMNLNYLLNRAYYEPMTYAHFNQCNRALCKRRFQAGPEEIPFSEGGIYLKTTYPGLLIGLGNPHSAGDNVEGKEEDGAKIDLGFTLDYVTGQPIIPGSTVKGVLRSAFKLAPDYTASLLNLEKEHLSSIEKAIFAEGSGKIIFFDAIPVKTGKDDHLFGLDNITPHFSLPEKEEELAANGHMNPAHTTKDNLLKKELAANGLLSPHIHTMLKVLPNVIYLFRFDFSQWKPISEVDENTLKEAFKEILITLGIGAKTRVGYGSLDVLYESEEKKMNKRPCYLEPMEPRARL